jgi:hypothetical protein
VATAADESIPDRHPDELVQELRGGVHQPAKKNKPHSVTQIKDHREAKI